eukprot:3259216-Alexandrium_andersonii.AAC.1
MGGKVVDTPLSHIGSAAGDAKSGETIVEQKVSVQPHVVRLLPAMISPHESHGAHPDIGHEVVELKPRTMVESCNGEIEPSSPTDLEASDSDSASDDWKRKDKHMKPSKQ